MQKRRRYTKAYKDDAIRLAMQSGISQAQVARDLDINAGLLNRWVVEAQRANGSSPESQVDYSSDEKLQRMQDKLDKVRTERDILKKRSMFIKSMTDMQRQIPAYHS